MRSRFCIVFLAACLTVNIAAAAQTSAADANNAHDNLLVAVPWLDEHIKDDNLVLLHVGPPGDFAKGHLPGAQLMTLQEISTPPDPSGNALQLELPPMPQLKETFEKHGISNNSRIVVYADQGWISPATRVIWTLNYMGLGDQTSLLDGGTKAWKDAGHAFTTETKTATHGQIAPQVHPEVFADSAWVVAHLHQPTVAVMDGRSKRDYSGIGGHVPGAKSLPIEELWQDNERLKDRATLAELLGAAGAKPGSQVVSYCYVGQRATLIWFVAKLLGHDARMYDGAWDEWSKSVNLPIELSAAQKGRVITYEKE